MLKFTNYDLARIVKQYQYIGTLLAPYYPHRISDTLGSLKSIWWLELVQR